MRRFLRRLRDLLFPRPLDRDIADEVRHHLEMETALLESRGHTPREARRMARARFGPVDATVDDIRRVYRAAWLDDAGRDASIAVRGFLRRPALPAAVMLTLALGIGAAGALAGAVRAVLLDDPPYADPDRLVFVWRTDRAGHRLRVPGPDAAEVRASVAGLESLAFLADVRESSLARPDAPALPVRVATATANWFDVLGVAAALGRGFLPGDGLPEAGPVWLLDDRFFRARLGADSSVLGGPLELDGRTGTVIGVLPGSFRQLLPPGLDVPGAVDVWEPLRAELMELRRPEGEVDQDSDASGIVVARMASGAEPAHVQIALDAVTARLRDFHPAYAEAGWGLEVRGLHAAVVAGARPVLQAVGAAVLLVLVLAGANAAGLLLTRAVARSRELAVRVALGARRTRIVRQIVIENGLLALCGGVAGVVLATVLLNVARVRVAALAPGAEDLRVDGFVLVVAGLITVAMVALTTAAVLLDPSLRASAAASLVTRGTTGYGRSARTLRSTLVALQVAVSLALLTGAGVMMRTARQLAAQDAGFRPADALGFRIGLAFPDRYRGPAERAALIARLEERILAVPGVAAVGLVGGLPLADPEFTQPWLPDGAADAEWGRLHANYRVVTPGYFDAVGTRLLEGRTFRAEDDRQDRRVVIVDAALAARVAPRGSALGRVLRVPVDGRIVRASIVGVVASVRFESLSSPGRETIYVPYRHEASRHVAFVVRATTDPLALERPIAGAIAAVDPAIAMHDVRALASIVDEALRPARDVTLLLSGFALVAVLLAIVALHAAVVYAVQRRTAEIGLRLALGATTRQVIGQAMRSGLAPCAAGLLLGVLLAAAGAPALRALVWGVSPLDPLTLACAAAFLGLVSTLACQRAARRAARVAPARALAGAD